uniref:Conserved oligomeric Golgi complex subunit 2 n=1 Tax=Aegilops tauschii subsp. strangulata TaxID=200361 RepID=A0A453MI04_AEGTS
ASSRRRYPLDLLRLVQTHRTPSPPLPSDPPLAMADLAAAAPRAPAPPQPPPAAKDLFGETIEAHPPWFRPEAFLRAGFDPDAYVAELRSYVPLESLAAELRSHLAALRAELVGLINRDYADFVG